MKKRIFGSVLFSTIKANLFKIIIQPVTYITGAIFVLSVNFAFFQLRGFFNLDTCSVEVRHIFSIIPYISALIIPTIVIIIEDKKRLNNDCLPVSSLQAVCARITASFIIYLFFLLLTVPSVCILNGFGDIEVSKVLTGYFGILLYGVAICSFCCFIATFFTNRIASFFVSVFVVFLVTVCHLLPQYVKLPNFLSTLLTFFSVAWHTDAAGKGIIDTKDIFFFITLTVLFAWLAVIKTDSAKKKSRPLYSVLVLCAGVLTIAVTSMFYVRIDTTKEKQFSLSETGKKVVKSADSPLSITYYLSPELETLYPQVRDVKDYLNTLATENKNISVLTVNPADLDSTGRLEELGILSQQLQTSEENKTSYVSVYSSILLEYGSNVATIPFLLSTASLEYDLLVRIRALTTGIVNTVFLYAGNGLSVDEYYPYLKPWLQASGFICSDVTTEELYERKNTDNVVLLVLGSSNTNQSDAAAIENWVLKGGAVFFAVSPNVTEIKGTWATKHTGTDPIIEMLDVWGIGIESGICVDNSACYRIRMYSSSGGDAKYIDYPYWLNTTVTNNSILDSMQPPVFYWASPLYFAQWQEAKVTPLVETSDDAWLVFPDDNEGEYITDPFLISYLVPDNKSKGKYVLAASLEGIINGCYDTRKSPSVRLIVAGDQYFPSSIIENTNSLYQNMDLLLSSILWLNNNDELIPIKNKGNINTTPYKITSENEFASKTTGIKTVCFIIIPVSILIMYVFVDIIRKKSVSRMISKRKNQENNK